MKRFSGLLLIIFSLCFILSCKPKPAAEAPKDNSQDYVIAQNAGAWPMAVLKPGENPIWFQLTARGPVVIDNIADTALTEALVPWPLTLHVSFFQEKNGEIIMVINRDGFLKLAPYPDVQDGIAVYRFAGGELWRHYTVGGFIFYEDQPTALLYLDDRFLNSTYPPPLSRTWTFDMKSNNPYPIKIPAIEHFPAEEDWEVDTLRLGNDDYMYFRVLKRHGVESEVRLLRRTRDLSGTGREVSIDIFFNSIPHKTEVSDSSLPPLPVGYSYTAAGRVGNAIIATWEDQEDFSIGAAGFVAIKAKR
jgi:hypothetical protein